MEMYSFSKIHKRFSFILFVVFISFSLLLCETASAAVTVDLVKDGRDYADRLRDSGSVEKSGDNVKITGSSVLYTWDISEYYPWIEDAKYWVRIADVDDGWCKEDGTDWPKFYALDNRDLSNPSWHSLGAIDTTGWIQDGLGIFNLGFIVIDNPWKKSWIRSSDGHYYLDIMVNAPHCTSTDDADVEISEVKLELSLNYDFNTLLVNDPVVDFGEVNLVRSYTEDVSIRNAGDGSNTFAWTTEDTTWAKPERWIKPKSGSLDPGKNTDIAMETNFDKIGAGNIDELNGRLIPIFETGLDPKSKGLKGDFYHVPKADLGGLDAALTNSGRHLAYSEVFPSIEFHDSGGVNVMFDVYEPFKSGFVTTTLRRDFTAVFTGFVETETSGSHRFIVTTNNGFRLKINGSTLVEHAGQTDSAQEYDDTINLSKGYHSVELSYFQGGSKPKCLTLEWTPPGKSRAVVPQSALSNGLNILVRATAKKPTVVSTTPTGKNGKVHIACGSSSRFTVSAQPGSKYGSSSVPVTEYRWQRVTGDNAPGVNWQSTTQAEKTFPASDFSDPGQYMVYCKAVDQKGVESDPVGIPVRVWTPPEVYTKPPQAEIDAQNVSWYSGKYAGEVGESIWFMADGESGSDQATIAKYLWNFYDNWNTAVEQTPEDAVSSIWNSPSPSGRTVKCKAVTNYGIESHEQTFTVAIYDSVMANAEARGSYVSKPNVDINLEGSLNKVSYTNAVFQYWWYIDADEDGSGQFYGKYDDKIESTDGKATVIWTDNGDYSVMFEVKVTTAEGLVVTGTDEAIVTLDASKPKARPGGPYRGGIAGGNFSPIQFEGNNPDLVEDAENIGHIVDWKWKFESAGEPVSALKFIDTPTSVATVSGFAGLSGNCPRTVSAWIKVSELRNNPIVCWGTREAGEKWIFRVDETNLRIEVSGGYKVGTTDIADGKWHHVAVTFAGSNVLDTQLYVDGKLEGVKTSQSQSVNTVLWQPVWIGAGFLGDRFVGMIDDVAIWERALSAGEIHDLLNMSPLENDSDLVGYWPFDTISNTYTPDLSSHANTVQVTPGATLVRTGTGRVGIVDGIWNPTQVYFQAGDYDATLEVQSQYGIWSPVETTSVTVIDGKIEGYVKAADLRTPIKEVKLILSSSHVDPAALERIVGLDSTLQSEGGGNISTLTDDKGFYRFEHIPLGSYNVSASKKEGESFHEFEKSVQNTELTLDAPNQLAIDFTDISVYPISGRIVYSVKKDNAHVFVDNVEIRAQPVGSTSAIEALPSTKPGTGVEATNYSLPLFAGQYLFLAKRAEHDIRIDESSPGYDSATGLVTIDKARDTIDFIDYTTRTLTVLVRDSGGYNMPEKDVIVIGINGHQEGQSDENGEFEAILPPGGYTVTVPGAKPESEEVDLTGEDQEITMIIPVTIELSFESRPKLFGVSSDFLDKCGLSADDNPVGYMYYYPPEPRTHTYVLTATANGHPVEDITLFVTDEVSMMTEDEPQEQAFQVDGIEGMYVVTGGLPELDRGVVPPAAAPKSISFRAEKDGYGPSDSVTDAVTVLGDVAVGTAAKIVSIPTVNYLVLHDPPGDGSYSYFDDSMTVKGIVSGMSITLDDRDVPVYPSPWSADRTIQEYLRLDPDTDEWTYDLPSDLEYNGLLGYRDSGSAGANYTWLATVEVATGAVVVATGPVGYAIQLIASGLKTLAMDSNAMSGDGLVQYEVTPSRHLETPSGDSLPDLLGPGKGDIYYGEGWTLGLQTKYRLCIEPAVDDNGDPVTDSEGNTLWQPATQQIETYDILERTNQYIYTIRDLENIVDDLERTISQVTDEDEKTKLADGKSTWEGLLSKNLAYTWSKYYVATDYKIGLANDQIAELEAKKSSEGLTDVEQSKLDKLNEKLGDLQSAQSSIQSKGGDAFRAFKDSEGSSLPDEGFETLIFSAGPKFEYSRTISESSSISVSTGLSVNTEAHLSNNWEQKAGFELFGTGTYLKFALGASTSLGSTTGFESSWESGLGAQQKVGFVLNDNDIGDNISTRVYTDPVWGTPLFFQDAGSYTSDPWEPGTNKAVDVVLEMASGESVTKGPFDYHDGAHYNIVMTYTGERDLESIYQDVGFALCAPQTDNEDSLSVRFNSQPDPYGVGLSKQASTANLIVSLYPPEKDQGSSEEKQYEIDIVAYEEEDAQISRTITLMPKFADLRAPRATIAAPYDGQRISPVFFPPENPFDIEVASENTDLASIQLQIRSKQPDGVWEPWANLANMLWEDGGANSNVVVFERLDRDPPRREFTFKWEENGISALGVGEYAIRAVATDKATNPNTDIDPPHVVFLVDSSKPTVLTTMPDYQARESERIYRGELSVTFTDDMRADDFSSRTFVVSNLLQSGDTEAGFVSYSPALRKAVFVPAVPFEPNGFYRAEVKTDTVKDDGSVEKGVHDLAGNPLDNAFMWTFRTTDAPFEPTWSITLSASDGADADGNNIAGVEYGALDGEDEKDARSAPALISRMRMNFLNRGKEEFDRDIRPADGRLSHHWFFAIDNAANGAEVTISYKPSIKLTQVTRQYQDIWLVEFDADGNVTNRIKLDPTEAPMDASTGQIGEVEAYTYTNGGETSRYFRLDVQKASLVATEFRAGSSGWRFLSVPITPQRADPFVNLGDDIDPFQLYRYDTETDGYKIYPLDIGEVSLQAGRGYFTRLESDVEVDVGGASNYDTAILTLDSAGWHAIGNPFIVPVAIGDLMVNDKAFADAGDLVEGTLYRWKIDEDPVNNPDSYEPLTSVSQLDPWEGYWIKTKQDNVTIVIPASNDLWNAEIELPGSFQPPMAPSIYSATHPLVAESQFFLQLELVSSFSADVTTTLGTHRDAQIGCDSFDQSEPPTLGKTVSTYFDHSDWGDLSGLYNSDYQPALEPGEERIWRFKAYTDTPDAEMSLSWEKTISQVPGDIMLYFRRAGDESEWQDMRKVRSVDLVSHSRITEVEFEVMAHRFEMSPPSDVQIAAGEKQVTLRWNANDNEFIEGYVVTRQTGSADDWKEEKGIQYALSSSASEFVDTDILEEVNYTYQVSVYFMSGAELQSGLFTVRTLPVVKQTVLLQSYPNPFNPEVWIPYELAEESPVSIRIYSASGQLVRALDMGVQPRGRYISKDKSAYWDGRTQTGEQAASGVYFYVFKSGKFSAARKMVILK